MSRVATRVLLLPLILACTACGAVAVAAISAHDAHSRSPGPQRDIPRGAGNSDSSAKPTPTPTIPFRAVVIRDVGTYHVGDTVTVDTSPPARLTDQARRVLHPTPGRDSTIAIGVLGPRDSGTMIVSAASQNIRSCPRTSCSVVRRVTKGSEIRVREYEAGWYQAPASGGYVSARDLELPIVMDIAEADSFILDFGMFFDEVLSHAPPGEIALGVVPPFSHYELDFQGTAIYYRLWTPFLEGPEMNVVCDELEVTANRIDRTFREASPSRRFRRYSLVVYFGSPQAGYSTGLAVAHVGADGSLYCDAP